MKMKYACLRIGLTLFYILLIVLVFWFSPALVDGVEEKDSLEKEVWWGTADADPPELVAFSWKFPIPSFAIPGMFIQLVPEFVVEREQGVPIGIAMSVEVTSRVKNRVMRRRVVYHNVWADTLEHVFFDTSFVKRTWQENREIALGDPSGYWQRVDGAVKNINSVALGEGFRVCEEFIKRIGRGERVEAAEHREVDIFMRQTDNTLNAYEPYLGIQKEAPEEFIIIYDYKPWVELQFVLHVVGITEVAFFEGSFTYQRDLLLAEIIKGEDGVWSPTLPWLARQVFYTVMNAQPKSR